MAPPMYVPYGKKSQQTLTSLLTLSQGHHYDKSSEKFRDDYLHINIKVIHNYSCTGASVGLTLSHGLGRVRDQLPLKVATSKHSSFISLNLLCFELEAVTLPPEKRERKAELGFRLSKPR